jgi:acetaldehyde dehydrogenase / alcohol dehydrogenase
MPRSLAEHGLPELEWEAAREDLCRAAFSDPSGRTNPRMPLLSELSALLEAGYGR